MTTAIPSSGTSRGPSPAARAAATGPRVAATAVLGALLLAACSPAGDADPLSLARGSDAAGETVFLTLDATPDAWMEALYEGAVGRDPDGCLRLATADARTVVWPAGFRLAGAEDELRVLDGEGREVGRIGGAIRLTGGEVASLHEGLPMSAAARREAEARCPGRFWLAGDASGG